MNRIDDCRIAFFLRHQTLIEEWAKLAPGAAEAAHTFLCSCEDDSGRLATELSPEVRLHSRLEGEYPKLLMYMPEWLAAHDSDAGLRLGVGLEWHHKSGLGFVNAPRCAYAGVWVNLHLDGGKELSRTVRRVFAQSGLVKQHKLDFHEWWPAYRYERASGEYWNDLAPYRAQLVDSVRFFWGTFVPRIRQALAGKASAV